MNLPLLEPSGFRNLICQETPIMDVRAPVEFHGGRLPNSLNIPILNDEERKQVGTLYKEAGQEAAISLGHQLVSGALKRSRIEAWMQQVQKNPETVITCFRGGMRSQLTQSWLAEQGCVRPRLQGGYKAMRNFLLDELGRLSARKMVVLSGATGCGKTLLIRETMRFRPTVDLEKLAHHRGSAFGGFPGRQPSQAEFENELSAGLIRIEHSQDSRPLIVEDESRMIGSCAQPAVFFESLRSSSAVLLEEPLASRVQTTFEDYILNTFIGQEIGERGLDLFLRYRMALGRISKKLGGLQYSEIEKNMIEAEKAYEKRFDLEPNKVWIEKLLSIYYDPLYFKSLDKRDLRVLFRGRRKEALEFLKSEPTIC